MVRMMSSLDAKGTWVNCPLSAVRGVKSDGPGGAASAVLTEWPFSFLLPFLAKDDGTASPSWFSQLTQLLERQPEEPKKCHVSSQASGQVFTGQRAEVAGFPPPFTPEYFIIYYYY